MTSLESVLHRIAADLTRSNVDFALIGGLAVSVRTEPRFTRDVDLVDLRALLRAATTEDVTRAREALALIADRGYHRGRELAPQLDALLA